jgi:branched-chain amino acid transport system substrate-binding protein
VGALVLSGGVVVLGAAPTMAASPRAVVIATDLPLSGISAQASTEANAAMQFYLSSYLSTYQRTKGKPLGYTVSLRTYDDASPATGVWNTATCAANARQHLARTDEVAVIGTYNSGCSKVEVPILNTAGQSAPLMVSHANTNGGLTRAWGPGEPKKYYPSGVRSYARVLGTDDLMGTASATYAATTLKRHRCAVLDDGTEYGRSVAAPFVARAKAVGITVVQRASWSPSAKEYSGLFRTAKAARADCVFVSGIADNNGAALLKAKVAVLGSNSTVPVLAPDGFTGYPAIDQLPAAQGMYLSFSGLTLDVLRGRAPGRRFLTAFEAAHGPVQSSYSLYAVAALQVVLTALETSDRTRAGVRKAVLAGKGLTLPAATVVLGEKLAIDPKTGDVRTGDVTLLRVTGQREVRVASLVVPKNR